MRGELLDAFEEMDNPLTRNVIGCDFFEAAVNELEGGEEYIIHVTITAAAVKEIVHWGRLLNNAPFALLQIPDGVR